MRSARSTGTRETEETTMKMTEARMELAGGNSAVYVDVEADVPRLPDWPVLAIHVDDFEEALEIVATLDRSRARKRAAKDPSPGPAAGAAPPATEAAGPGGDVVHVPLPPRCLAPDCPNEAVAGAAGGGAPELCHMHAGVSDSIANEWRRAR